MHSNCSLHVHVQLRHDTCVGKEMQHRSPYILSVDYYRDNTVSQLTATIAVIMHMYIVFHKYASCGSA